LAEPQITFDYINPESLGAPRGYSNGVLTSAAGRLLFVAGQIGWDEKQAIVSDDFVAQFDRALANVITVVTEAGGSRQEIARLVMYVTDKKEYRARREEIGRCYRAHLGKHFPAMVLVEVKSLLDDSAKVEIEAIAVLNP
jgi:enamine deaminase RidA (YjgF/YER057c/UK114 family)